MRDGLVEEHNYYLFICLFVCLFVYIYLDGWLFIVFNTYIINIYVGLLSDIWDIWWIDKWMDGWMDGWMGGWMDGWMGGWVDVDA